MKRIISIPLIVTTVFLSFSFNQPQSDNALARVNITTQKQMFFYNEPLNEYEVAFTFLNGIVNIDCKSPQSIITESIRNANLEGANQGKIYDAIIIGSAERDLAITWKDKTKDNSIARVRKTEGKLVFIECEPITEYDIVGKFDIKGSPKKCPTLQEKIDNLLKKSNRKKLNFDGVMYASSKYDLAIKFK